MADTAYLQRVGEMGIRCHDHHINEDENESREGLGVHSCTQECSCVPRTDDKPKAMKAIKLVVSRAPDKD